ncbi:Replication protein P [Ewingella americana]|uniref:Replication protein P n=1 Tax=Ewingella americana TaxID=41202 RepID=A0A377NC04_9GAMM|nr:Replication protein P [Ewingella americana]
MAFAENGIRSREQLSAGMQFARASGTPFGPSPGQFIEWCKKGAHKAAGLPDRAIKEARRLLYSRISAGITALADGEWVNVGEMIQVSDMYDTNQQDGYITERLGDQFDTSERIKFDGEMYVVVTDSTGTPTQRVRAYPRPDTDFGFIASVPSISLNIWDGVNVQSPSRFIIATQVEMDATKWVITEKRPNSDGTTGLTASEYSDAMYDYVVTE